MAEKRVSVRLVAEGGRQVRAEFQGIGDAGEASFKRIERQADVTGAVLRRLAGIVAGALSIRQLVVYADQWTGLRSRVDLATGSQEAGAAVMDRLASMARRTYSSLGQTTESWLANATALRELGLTTAESLDFTEALNNATRINGFIEALNSALSLLPDWATGEGGVRIGTLAPVELGRIGNPFESAATAAGTAAADAFTAAMGKTYVTAPDTGLGAMADAARGRADGYREAAGMLSDAASRPMASWQALKDAVTGARDEAGDALDGGATSADVLTTGLDDTTGAAGRAGAAGRQAGADVAAGAETAATGWAASAPRSPITPPRRARSAVTSGVRWSGPSPRPRTRSASS